MIKLTLENINRLRTEKNGFTKATVEALGLKWSDVKTGWMRRQIGREISEEDYARAYEAREKKNPDHRKTEPQKNIVIKLGDVVQNADTHRTAVVYSINSELDWPIRVRYEDGTTDGYKRKNVTVIRSAIPSAALP